MENLIKSLSNLKLLIFANIGVSTLALVFYIYSNIVTLNRLQNGESLFEILGVDVSMYGDYFNESMYIGFLFGFIVSIVLTVVGILYIIFTLFRVNSLLQSVSLNDENISADEKEIKILSAYQKCKTPLLLVTILCGYTMFDSILNISLFSILYIVIFVLYIIFNKKVKNELINNLSITKL